MRKVQIYIEGELLDLFSDEQIQITSSVQNVQDIAKVFTDFSQSFTVPATPRNNKIFQYFYESEFNTLLDSQLRRSASIEIDLVPFRTGKVQMEKSNVKKGMAESYTITFFGDVRTLQDYFGEDKLATLDLSAYNHPYTGAEVQQRITSTTNYDIRYPLISSDRAWTYQDSAPTDIHKTSDRMGFSELSPAIKIARIFNAIEAKYGIDFQGAFLTDLRFDNAFLYLKNKETFLFQTEPKQIDITAYSGYDVTGYVQRDCYDITNNSLHIVFDPEDISPAVGTHNLNPVCTYVSDPSVTYYLDVYCNGVLDHTVAKTGTGQIELVTYENTVGLDKTFTFVVRADQSINIKIVPYYYQYRTQYIDIGGGVLQEIYQLYTFEPTVTTLSLSANFDISGNMPDMLVSDFVKGILKEFNLTIAPKSPTVFELMPLEDWYSKGRIINITKHTDIDSIDYERVKLYKKISFKYQKSESFMNRQFTDFYSREYGDLEQTFDYDGTEYTIESPFENLLFNRFSGTDLQVGYLLDRNRGKYVPKPLLLYMAEQKSCDFKFFNGSTTVTISNYMPFGQDTKVNNQFYSLNFGNEISSLRNVVVNGHIFNTYYANYINNLYVRQNRLVYVKCFFPLSILSSIRLNDRVVIRDKRYIINEMKSNLITGEVDLVLLLDFRKLIRTVSKERPAVTGTTFKSPVILPNGAIKAMIDVGSTGIVATPDEITEDTNVEFVIPANTDPAYYLITEDGIQLDTEDYFDLRSEEGQPEILNVVITYEYEDGTTEEEDYPFVIKDL